MPYIYSSKFNPSYFIEKSWHTKIRNEAVLCLIGLRKKHTRRNLNWNFVLIICLAGLSLIVFQSSFAVPLTQSECNALGTTKVGIEGNYTFICGFPFNASIPFRTHLVWIDTQQWQGKYHHTITSVNGTFDWKDQTMINVLISQPFKVGHIYKFYDELNSNQTGYIKVIPRNGTSSVTILDPSQVRMPNYYNMTIPTNSTDSANCTEIPNNNSTPLMLPPSSVGLPNDTSWVNPNNYTNNTTNATEAFNGSSTQCATGADISGLSKEIQKLEAQNLDLQTQLSDQKKMTNVIFGMLTKLLHNFNLN